MSKTDVLLGEALTLVAGAAMAANTLVKIDTAGKAINSVAGDVPLGVVYDAFASADYATVYGITGKSQVTAGAAIAIGDYVKCGAAGKVVTEATATTPTAFTIGQARSVASADGDLLYIACAC